MRLQLLVGSVVGIVVSSCGPQTFPVTASGARVIIQLREDPTAGSASPIVTVTGARPFVLEKRAVTDDFPQLTVSDGLEELPMLVFAEVDDDAFAALGSHPLIEAAWREEQLQLLDAESFALIRQPQAADAGLTGSGATVAVLDTGLDYRKPEFGTCATVGAAGCFVPLVRDFAPDDAALDDNGHGTNVAAIVRGVAPGARVIGLDVFQRSGASSADIISAINWVVANRAAYNIVAMNLSLGGGASTTTCEGDVFATPVATARAAGVLSVIASGNNAYTNALSSPACVPEALSVGAVYDANVGSLSSSVCSDASSAADKVACFSNSASYLSVLAPGVAIAAGGWTMSGTSQATPHVAGAIAVLAAKFPSDAPSKRASRVLSGATLVKDARNGVTRPRLTMGPTFGACSVSVPSLATVPAAGGSATLTVTPSPTSCSWSVTGAPSWLAVTSAGQVLTLKAAANPGASRATTLQVAGVTVRVTQPAETTPPVGSVTVAATTKVSSVTVSLSATDPSGVQAMCVSTGTTCTSFVPYATAAWVTLPAGDGVKTIRAWFRDGVGNTSSSPATATVKLDTTAPVNGVLSRSSTGTTLTLKWSGFTDVTSGIASYRVVRSTSPTVDAPAGCASGTTVYAGAGLTTSTSLASKTVARFRVCAIDVAGNVSSGAALTVTMP